MNQLPSPVDAQGQITSDINCFQCGYNLRGLAATGTCPECGQAVQTSFRDGLLQFSTPDWISKVALGSRIVIWTILAFFVFVAILIAFEIVGLSQQVLTAILTVIMLGLTAAMCVAVWLLTEPEPGPPTEDHEQKRTFGRWLVLISIGSDPIMTVFEYAGLSGVSTVLSLILGIVAIIGFVMLMLYLRTLALRVPDASLAKQTAIVLVGVGVCYGLILLAMLTVFALATANSVGPGGGAAATPAFRGTLSLMCLILPFILVFGIWQLLIFDKYRRVFTEAADKAARNFEQV